MSFAKIDATGWNALVRRYMAEAGKTAREVVNRTAKLTCQQLIVTTQPYGVGAGAKAKGESAVSSDIGKTLVGANSGFIERLRSEHGDTNVKARIGRDGDEPLRIDWERIITGEKDADAYHEKRRNKRGRVRGRRRSTGGDNEWTVTDAAVVPYEVLAAVRKRRISLVGLAKAGWHAAYTAIRGPGRSRAPRWVKRHGGGLGVASEAGGSDKPTVIFSNRVRGADIACNQQTKNAAVVYGQKQLYQSMRRELKHLAKKRNG